MFVRILKVKYFEDHFYAFAGQRTKECELISMAQSFDFQHLDIITNFETSELYLNQRYKVR